MVRTHLNFIDYQLPEEDKFWDLLAPMELENQLRYKF